MNTIIWDVDDVLNNLMAAWFEDHMAKAPGPMTYDAIIENPPHRLLNIPKDDYFESLDAFRNSEKGANLTPNPVILNWFRKNGGSFRHVALTARPRKTASSAANWVFHHFGDWIRTIHFVPAPRKNEMLPLYDENKSAFLEWFGKADYFIDDSPENIDAVKPLNIKTFLYPQPWNTREISVPELLNQLVTDSRRKNVHD